MAKIDKLLKKAEAHFETGEKTISAVLGAYETKVLGSDSFRNGIMIATNKRLIFFAKKLTGFDLEVFPYKNISSFEMGKNLMGHHVSFFASGNKAKVKWIHGDNFQEFVEAVKENMATQGTPSTPQQASSDPMKQLEKLGKLRDSGVVTKEEFESKKAEILSRI